MSDDNSRIMTARLLRVIASDLEQRIIPDLRSADAIERASLSRMVAEVLAADLDVAPGIAAKSLPRLAELLAQANNLGSRESALSDDLVRLRYRAVASMRAVTVPRDPIESRLRELGRWDAQWVLDYEAAIAARKPATSGAGTDASGADAAASRDLVTVDNATTYLRRRWPNDDAVRATEVIQIPGGRSKKTYFLTVEGSSVLPRQLVMRQDYALKYAGTKVVEEYRPLAALADFGLPVPRPLHLETEVSELGPPFIFVNRLTGKPPGTYFSQAVQCPGAFRELAKMLARLHRVDPTSLGFAAPEPGKDYLLALIRQYQKKWRDNATIPSPVIDYACLWSESQCNGSTGIGCFVHGDAGPYNFLAADDRLTAILDWEFAHVGDPAEDLGIARAYAESCMDWSEFLTIYRDAGGYDIPDKRVQLGMMAQFLKGATLTAASGRNFLEGGTNELVKGASSFTGVRMIEPRIARLLQRFGAF